MEKKAVFLYHTAAIGAVVFFFFRSRLPANKKMKARTKARSVTSGPPGT